jgi:hypothetical protein
MNWFWSGFWPNLASTLVGVIVGVPIALWLNKLAGGAAERRQSAEQRARLRKGLQGLLAAFCHNRQRLQVLIETLTHDKAPFDPALDTAAWEASREEIVPCLQSPDLQRRIAFHFSRLSSVSRLCSVYLDLAAGVASAIGGVENTRSALRNHLVATAEELLAQTRQLAQEVEVVMPPESTSA